MNQILEFGTEKRGKTPKGHNHKSGGSSSDKIVKVFAILLMVFAVVLIGSGVYSLVSNNTEESTNTTSIQEGTEGNITINAVLNEETLQVDITVESEAEISKVVYNWNSDSQITVDGNNQTTFSRSISVPVGTNTLTIKVTDVEGNSKSDSFDFESTSGVDITDPNIVLEQNGSTLVITATDETELAYLTYKWNEDGATTTVYPEDDDLTTITVEVEIPKGTNTIIVYAVDASIQSNTVSEVKELTAQVNPTITYGWKDSNTLTFTCTHEDGIKEIHYTLNGQEAEAVYTEEDGYPTYVEFDVVMENGYNTISVSVTSTDGATETFDGECTLGESEDDDTENTDETNN